MYKFSKNTFNKGLNKDIDDRVVPADSYRDAVNVTIVREGEILSLSTIGGSEVLSVFETLATENLIILGSYECNIEEGKGVVVFYKGEDIYGTKYNGIKLVDFKNDTVYEIANGLWLNFEDVDYVDGVIDNDNGHDIIYFVDDVNPPRFLKCLTSNIITNDKELCNLRFAPVDAITETGVPDGGFLLSGSYQVAYQFNNTTTGVESTPSLFTNAIPIYPTKDITNLESVYGGVPNEQTSKKIELKINTNTSNDDINEIRGLYDSVSLLIIKSIDGSKTASLDVLKVNPSKSIYESVINGSGSFDYKGNETGVLTTLDQISVDDALIETAKSITIKEGNIFLGGIKYRDLTIKDSEATFGDATTVVKRIGLSNNILEPNNITNSSTSNNDVEYVGAHLNPLNCSKYKSEMRGEVIRYGIVYTDKYGGWSEPKPFNFSAFSAFNRVSETQLPISSVNEKADRGGTEFIVANSPDGSFTEGDSIQTNDDDFHLIMEANYLGSNNYELFVNSFFTSTPSYGYKLKGWKYSHTLNSDWKYPSRNNAKHTLFDDGTTDSLSSLGLKINDIDNHPSWSIGFAIVRVQRSKDILTQAISVPCYSANGSADLVGDDVQPASYANITGSFLAKQISRGGNVNYTRWTPDNNGYSEPIRSSSNDNGVGGRQDVLPMAKLLSPDYMYSNVGNTEIYDATWFGVGYQLDIVDAISVLRTNSIKYTGQIDEGGDKGDQQAISFRADGRGNYYYQRGLSSSNIERIVDPNNNRPLYRSNNYIKGYYPSVNGIAPIALPSSILPNNNVIREIVVLGDLKGVSGYNTSNEAGEDINAQEQKGVYVVLKESMGDLSFFSAKFGSSLKDSVDYYRDYIQFARDYGNSDDYNVDILRLNKTGGSSSEWLNLVEKNATNSIGVFAITNIVKGLNDDRYGDINKTHNFLPTGSYRALYDNKKPVSLDVFGGDVFISKPTFKVNESILGGFQIGDRGGNQSTAVRAYSDWVELVGCYIESEVNSQLQANPYSYPIENKETPTEFKTDYNYPYHFGYSTKNLSKVFVNNESSDSDVNYYPSRIAYSDKHIINSNDGNYSRFRVSSVYDLDGSYGNITKLLKAYDDNIYCLQENGFCLVPVGKKTIEDGSGGEMVINTSDTITTPKYFLSNNGCQNIESVRSSKDSFYWADRDRREVFIYKGGVNRISDKGMYSFFNQELDRYTGRLDGVFDMDREEYVLTIGSKSVIFSSKLGAWVSLFDLEGFNSFVNGEDRLFIIGKNGLNINMEEMYVTDEQCNILGSYNNSEISVVFNDGGTIPKTFDVVRVDSTAHIDECEMSVRTLNDGVMNTGAFAIENRGRQGGYEYPSIRDIDTGQRLRGKSCTLTLRTKNDVDTKNVSINSVMLKYRESPNAFIKRYKQTK